MDVEGSQGGQGALEPSELDHIAQALYGVIAALNAHLRRSHRASSEPGREVAWAIEQLGWIHERLTRASHAD